MTPEILEAVKTLRSGGIVAYPTETFYGLGVDALNEQALAKLVQIKGRAGNMPFPVLVSSVEEVRKHVKNIPPLAETWMKKYWPGPLTIILSAPQFPKLLQGANGGVGFRISSHSLAQQLVLEFGKCITTTSANKSGIPPATTFHEVKNYFKESSITVIEASPTQGGKPSTVVDFSTPKKPRLIREGVISAKELQL